MQPASTIYKARDLSPDLLQEDENISVRAFKGNVVKPAPVGEARDEAFRRLRRRVDQTAKRAEGVPETDIDAAIDEAADHVRQHG